MKLANLEQRVDKESFTFDHKLAQFQQLNRDELCEMILRLPSQQIAASRAGAGADADILRADKHFPLERSLRDALENLETSNTFVKVRKPETDDAFAGIYSHLHEQLDEMASSAGTSIEEATMFLFLASPGAITPFHLDKYSAFLLQLKGTKKVHIWSPWQHNKVDRESVEAFVANSIPRTPAANDLSGSNVHILEPGDGVHIPCVAPHMVENGNEVSISLSVHFNTKRSKQKLNALRMNDLARRWFKANPNPVAEQGNSVEWAKAKTYVALTNLRKKTLRSEKQTTDE